MTEPQSIENMTPEMLALVQVGRSARHLLAAIDVVKACTPEEDDDQATAEAFVKVRFLLKNYLMGVPQNELWEAFALLAILAEDGSSEKELTDLRQAASVYATFTALCEAHGTTIEEAIAETTKNLKETSGQEPPVTD